MCGAHAGDDIDADQIFLRPSIDLEGEGRLSGISGAILPGFGSAVEGGGSTSAEGSARAGQEIFLRLSSALTFDRISHPNFAGGLKEVRRSKYFESSARVVPASLSRLSGELGGADGIGLEELSRLAIENHPEISAKKADLDGAIAGRDSARWQYFPSPSVQVRRDGSAGAVTVAAVQQPLWSGGRLNAAYDAADARVRSASVGISDAQYQLALRVMDAWQAWMQSMGRIEALERAVLLLKGYEASVSKRIRSGISPEVDSELVVARLAQTQGDLALARASERSAISLLSQLVGKPLQTGRLSRAWEFPANSLGLEAVLDQSIAGSPSLKKLDAELEAARHDVAQKRAVNWPTVAVRAEHQRSDNSTVSSLFTRDNRLMLVMDYSPGAGLSAASGIESAEAVVRNMQERRDAAQRDLVSKVVADYETYASARARSADARKSLHAAADVLSSYARLFVAGKRSWLDLLNAARELSQAELLLADIDAQGMAGFYRLRVHAGQMAWQRESGV